jgi:hypothetical protein
MFRVARIEISGRLIGEQNGRAMNERSCNGRALLFTTAQLMWKSGSLRAQSHEIDRLTRRSFGSGSWDVLQQQWKRHVFFHSHRREQIEKLKNNAEFPPPVFGQLTLRCGVEQDTIDNHFA